MSQVQVIHFFHHVIGKFVAGAEADPTGPSLRVDDINPGHFGFLSSIIGKG